MEFNTEKIGDITVVTPLANDIDVSNADDFKTGIFPILEGNSKIIFDMNQVEFLDSSGCGALLSCLRQMNKSGGSLRLCSVQKAVRTLLEIVRMHQIIQIFNTVEEAVSSLQTSG
ncbi:MAG: STAS domain-containing protein [Desulfobacterales bacterium]|nr:STAS domain-containing protein [Desulfobacterales bacterium]